MQEQDLIKDILLFCTHLTLLIHYYYHAFNEIF